MDKQDKFQQYIQARKVEERRIASDHTVISVADPFAASSSSAAATAAAPPLPPPVSSATNEFASLLQPFVGTTPVRSFVSTSNVAAAAAATQGGIIVSSQEPRAEQESSAAPAAAVNFFATTLQPLEALRQNTFANLNAKDKSVDDTTLRDLQVISQLSANISKMTITPSAVPEAPPAAVAAGAAAPGPPPVQATTRRASNSWFQEAGGMVFFSNILARHWKLAQETALSQAAGVTSPDNLERLVSCVTPAHVSYYLFEATGRERPCCNDENCVARRCIPHPLADETEAEKQRRQALEIVNQSGVAPGFQWNPDAGRGGIVLKEFLDVAERNDFIARGRLPPQRGPCILCMRAQVTFDVFLAGFRAKVASAPHYHPVDVRGGYKRTACLQFGTGNSRSKGLSMPTRYFDATEYRPTTLAEAMKSEVVALFPQERETVASSGGSVAGKAVRGYFEDGSVHFFRVTRWLSPQASSLGADACATYAPALGRLPGLLLHPFRCLANNNGKLEPSVLSEIVARTGCSTETIETMLCKSFGESCLAVKNGAPETLELISSLNSWERFGYPRPISKYSILATLLARMQLVKDFRRSVAYDVDIMITNKQNRKKCRSVSSSSSSSELPADVATAKPIEKSRLPITTFQARLRNKILKKLAAEQRTALEQMSTGGASSYTPAKKTGGRGRRSRARDQTDASSSSAMLGYSSGGTDTSKFALEGMDEVLVVMAQVSKSHKPLLRWMYAQIHQRRSVSDEWIMGCRSPEDNAKFLSTVGCALGDLCPDNYSCDSAAAASATGTGEAADADIPVVRFRFPSHRELLLKALPRALHTMRLRDFLANHPAPLPDDISVADTLDEFWKTALHFKTRSEALEARVALAQRLSEFGNPSPAVLYHLKEFEWTHLDLALYPDADPDATYPSDSRNFIDSDAPPICALLTQCSFFEQVSDPVVSRSVMHAFIKTICRACNSREARSVTAQACLENHAFAMLIVKLVQMVLLGAYPHANYRPPFAVALRVVRTMKAFGTDVRLRALLYATQQAHSVAKVAEENTIPRCSRIFRGKAVDVALAMIRILQRVPDAIEDFVPQALLRPFVIAADSIRKTLTDALAFELVHRCAPGMRFEEALEMVGRWWMDSTSQDVQLVATRAVPNISGGGIFGGDSLCDLQVPMDLVVATVRAAFVSVAKIDLPAGGETCAQFSQTLVALLRAEAHKRTTADSCFIVSEADVRAALVRVLESLFVRFAPTKSTFTQKHFVALSIQSIGPYLSHGLSFVVWKNLYLCAPDVLDVVGACFEAVGQYEHSNERDRVPFTRVAPATVTEYFRAKKTKKHDAALIAEVQNALLGIAQRAFFDRKVCSLKRQSKKANTGTSASKKGGDVISEKKTKRRRTRGKSGTAAAAAAVVAEPQKKPKEEQASPNMLAKILVRLAYDAVADARSLALISLHFGHALTDYAICHTKASQYCKAAGDISASAFSSEPFVEANSTLVHYAVREALVNGLSRNPILARAFCDRGSWFPEFMEHCVDVADHIRQHESSELGLPEDGEVKSFALSVRRQKWGGQVFRLHRPDEAWRFTKILNHVRNKLLQSFNIVLKDETVNHESRLRVALEYILAQQAAHGNDPLIDPHMRDMDVLWRLGLREHGLAIVARMHRRHTEFPGNKELVSVVREFTPSEFLLVSEYYQLLYVVNSVYTVPLRCRQWTENALAAVSERHSIPDGSRVFNSLLCLFVCDSCASIVTQLTPRAVLKNVDLSSCYGASIDATGRLVCANRRNLGKKDKAEEKEMVTAIAASRTTKTKSRRSSKLDDDDDSELESVEDEEEEEEEVEAAADEDEEADDKNSILHKTASILPACKDARIRAIPGVGRMVVFMRKYRSPKEKVPDAKLDLFISPCCGKWMRFSRDDWVGSGFVCAACVFTQSKRSVASSNVCVGCGTAFKTDAGLATSMMTLSGRKSQAEMNIYNEMIRRNELSYNIRPTDVDHLQERMNAIAPSLRVGATMPVAYGSPNIFYVIDDEVTLGLIPVGLCRFCADARFAEWPVLMSTLRDFCAKRMKDTQFKALLRMSGFAGRKSYK